MSRKRFSDIKRGGRLNQALGAYTNRLNNPPPRNVGGGGARAPQQEGSIIPYGFGDFATEKIIVRRPVTGAQLDPFLVVGNKATFATSTAGAVKQRGFSPARVTTQSGARSISTPTSQFTQQEYLKYNNLTRLTSAFGRAAATDLEFEARDSIRTDFLANTATVIKRISFSAEARFEYL